MCELYNAIYLTFNDSIKLNEQGYAITSSSNLGCKIWSLANDWEALLLRRSGYRNPKQVLMGMTVYRLTQSKEIAQYLSKSNVCISYHDVRLQTLAWNQMIKSGEGRTTKFKRGGVTHSSIDNIDEETESLSIHFTNSNIYQPNPGNVETEEGFSLEYKHPGSTEEVPPYEMGQLIPPKRFPNFIDDVSTNLIDERFKINMLWSVIGGIPDTMFDSDCIPLLGSWTHFNKQISKDKFSKAVLQYMPTVPQPVSDYCVLKAYLDFLLETADTLELQNIFAHCDEAVYSKLLHIIWSSGDTFTRITPFLGGFHQLLTGQKTLYQRHGCIGYQKWFAASGIVKSDVAAEKAFSGRHYNSGIRVLKESFDAIIQMRTEDLTTNYKDLDYHLKESLINVRKNPSEKNVNQVLNMQKFSHLIAQIVEVSDTQSQMTVTYLKDINILLSLIFAARTSNFDLHLQSERQLLNLIRAFDRVHYTRYNTYHHVLLSEHKRQNTQVYNDLVNGGFTASLSGSKFSGVHGDYICETQNGETKRAGGPFKSGSISNISTFNTWMRTRHIGAEMQNELREIMHIKTSSTHRESTPYGLRRHSDNVRKLKNTARETFQFQFFSGPARAISTGSEIDASVIAGLLSSADRGNQSFVEFVEDRLVSGNTSLFYKIPKLKIVTGIIKRPLKSKPVQVLQEDVQGFGILAEQKTSLEEAFQYPVTTLPLSISEGEASLRTGSKSRFRNDLIDKSGCKTIVIPRSAVWIYDASRVIRCVAPAETYQEFFDALIKRMTPPEDSEPLSVHIILDKYVGKDSTKSCTRNARGEMDSNRLFITGLGQNMPSTTTQWQLALENSDTKTSLMSMFAEYILSGKAPLLYTTVVNNGDEMWMLDHLTKERQLHFVCNHEEADSRMIADAVIVGASNVVLCANDSDVFFLGVYACSINRESHWWIEYQNNYFVDLQDMSNSLGEYASYLPMFHAITGCDTTSYYHFRGKTSPWRKLLQNPDMLLLIEDLGKEKLLSEQAIASCVEFVRLVVYGGYKDESLVDTRVRMYRNQKKKKSSSLPPDPNSCRQDILRKHHQAYIWRRCVEPWIEPLNPEEYGWKKDIHGYLVPIWYTCSQFPPVMCKTRINKMNEGYNADDEGQSSKQQGKKKVVKKSTTSENQPPQKRSRLINENRKLVETVESVSHDLSEYNSYQISESCYDGDIDLPSEEDDWSQWERLSEFDSLSDDSSESDW